MQKFKTCAGIPDVEFYIMKQSADKQERLQKIRSAVFEKNPNAMERIYYGIPTVETDGKIILQYAAYKNHISLLVGNILPAILKEQFPQYKYTDYTVVFPDKEPFPEDFCKRNLLCVGAIDGRGSLCQIKEL